MPRPKRKPVAVKEHAQTAPQPRLPLLAEIALSNTRRVFPGGATEVYSPQEIFSRRGLEIVDKMRADDQIKAALSFKKKSCLMTGWEIASPGDEDPEWEPTVYVTDMLKRMDKQLEDRLEEMLCALEYGFSITEPVWDKGSRGPWVSDLKVRAPHDWVFTLDEHGNIVKMRQSGTDMPVERFILFVNDALFDDPYGTTDLGAAYRPWFIKDQAYRWLGALLERFGIPPIFALVNPDLAAASGYSDFAAFRDELVGVLKRLQAATAGVIPRDKPDNLDFWAPELAGEGADVFIQSIEMFDKAIARAMLMPGLLGFTPDTDAGSYARAQVHFDAFMLVLENLRRKLTSLLQRQVVEPACKIAFGALDEYPQFVFLPFSDDLRVDVLSEWTKMTGAGVVGTQPDDEDHIRALMKFPDRDPNREVQQQAQHEQQPQQGEQGNGQGQGQEQGTQAGQGQQQSDKRAGAGQQPGAQANKEGQMSYGRAYWNPDQPRDEKGQWTNGGSMDAGGRGLDYRAEGEYAHQIGMSISKGWQSKMSKKERADIEAYREGSGPVNDFLRNGTDRPIRAHPDYPGASKNAGDAVKSLDSAIKKAAPLEGDLVVYRGIHGDFAQKLGDGSEFTDKGFTSATLHAQYAHNLFAGEGGSVIKITVPAGRKVAYLSQDGAEKEVLLPRNSTFRITGKSRATVAGRSHAVIHAELV